MMKKIRQALVNHKTLVQNFSYLSIIQIINMLLPLVTYPYLIRTLGLDTYGIVVFAQAVAGYLVLFVSFGFNISATKSISLNRDNKQKLAEIISSVLILKGLLFFLSIVALLSLIKIMPQAKGYEKLFILMLWGCLYEVIFPIWYFQGIERMKYITVTTLVSRIIFLSLIFLTIKSKSDYIYVPVVNGIGAISAGIISLVILFRTPGIHLIIPSFTILKEQFKDSVPIFISRVSISLFVSSNKIIVGSTLGMTEVSYYDLADKLIIILKLPINLFTQAVFPKISKEKNLHFVRNILKLSFLGNLVLLIVFLFASKFVVVVIGGHKMLEAVNIIDILAFSLPFVSLSSVFGLQMLVPFGHEKAYSQSIVWSGVFYAIITLTLFVFNWFSLINITVVTLMTEIFLSIVLFYYAKRKILTNNFKLWSI